jgi:hypothetical protein
MKITFRDGPLAGTDFKKRLPMNQPVGSELRIGAGDMVAHVYVVESVTAHETVYRFDRSEPRIKGAT